MTGPQQAPAGGVDPARLIAAHHIARDFYRAQLLAADKPRGYLTRRGFGVFTRPHQPWAAGVDRPWHIGYAPPGWHNLTRHLAAHGYQPQEILAAGLATRTHDGRLVDLFRERLMFPIHNTDGHPVAFLARASPAAGTSVPKYLNTPDTDIFHKGQMLYGAAEQADRIAAEWAPVIVEGPLDVLAIWLAHPKAAGVGRVAVGTCGTNLTAHHAAAVYAMPGALRHGITTAFDPDEAGQTATTKAWRTLPLHPDIALRAAVLPDGCDPADLLIQPAGLATLRGALTHGARPLVQVVLDQHLTRLTAKHPDLLDHIEGRVTAARSLAAFLTDLEPDQVLGLVDYIAATTRTSIDTVANAVIDAVEQQPATPRATPYRRAQAPLTDPEPVTGASDATPAVEPDASRLARRGRPFAQTARPRPATNPAVPGHPVPGVTTRPRRPRG